MSAFYSKRQEIKQCAKELVLKFMHDHKDCQPGMQGLKQVQIFKQCGFDWGDYPSATSSHQQYWLVALLWELNKEGKVERVSESGPWRLV